ncbi:MAG: GPW/gp25 family protein [Candidatus Cloacimonetes bacterium]|nr:GPW/gp25 family protein [Actinomycetota bacterium]MBL7086472.1 GPW/gp25 family protein [Candidatus Cloacimonadota bacterium]
MDYTTIKFIGIKLPLTNSQYGYFNPSTVTLNQVKSNLQNLILTRKGERLMQPTFGCNIYNYLFENIDNIQIEENIQDMIQTTISM